MYTARKLVSHRRTTTKRRLYVCMYGHTYSKSKDQPGKVANPARGQLNSAWECGLAIRFRRYCFAKKEVAQHTTFLVSGTPCLRTRAISAVSRICGMDQNETQGHWK